MTANEIRHARETLAAQLRATIDDFERQTGTKVVAINVNRVKQKTFDADKGYVRNSFLTEVNVAIEI
jgi:hypothetical protein